MSLNLKEALLELLRRSTLSPALYIRIRQVMAMAENWSHTSANVSIRKHTSANVSTRQQTSACVSIHPHTSGACFAFQH